MNFASEKIYLGIDYGTRRIGIAKSDPTGLIASPITTLEVKSKKDAVAQLLKVIEDYRPAALVFGYPIHLSGDKSDKCVEIDDFIEKIEEFFDGEIIREDESYSSRDAHKIIHAHGKKTGKNKKLIDRLAAVIILQRFLDMNRY